MKLMFLNQLDLHKKLMLTCVPLKITRPKMDEIAGQAALVHSLVGEVRAQMPIPEELLKTDFVQLWVQNDPQVHLEVSSTLATQDREFTPQSLSVLRQIMDAHHGPQNIPIIHAMAKLQDSRGTAR